MSDAPEGRRWRRRLLWFAGLWLLGVGALAALAWLIRLAMGL